MYREACTQTDESGLNSPEETKIPLNPETSSSFSNPLPSVDSSEERNQHRRPPKRENVNRREGQSQEGEIEVTYDLSNSKKVKVGFWRQGQTVLVHIREYDGRYPTKKGIALTVPQWKRLFDNCADIDEDVIEINESYNRQD